MTNEIVPVIFDEFRTSMDTMETSELKVYVSDVGGIIRQNKDKIAKEMFLKHGSILNASAFGRMFPDKSKHPKSVVCEVLNRFDTVTGRPKEVMQFKIPLKGNLTFDDFFGSTKSGQSYFASLSDAKVKSITDLEAFGRDFKDSEKEYKSFDKSIKTIRNFELHTKFFKEILHTKLLELKMFYAKGVLTSRTKNEVAAAKKQVAKTQKLFATMLEKASK